MNSTNDFKQLGNYSIAIIGLGLIGGSLAGALKPHCNLMTGIDQSAEVLQIAKDRQLIHRGETNLVFGVNRADIVILATPVRTILDLLDQLGPVLSPGCLLMDVGSTKKEIVSRMTILPSHIQPLGGHPMCGKEISGVKSADPNLFRDQTFILTPLARTSSYALQTGKLITQTIGAKPLIIEPERHDQLVAATSHLPYLLACALVSTIIDQSKQDDGVLQVAASGFRDTSRLAASDVTMMLDILLTNRDQVIRQLDQFQSCLQELEILLKDQDENTLRSKLLYLNERRRKLTH